MCLHSIKGRLDQERVHHNVDQLAASFSTESNLYPVLCVYYTVHAYFVDLLLIPGADYYHGNSCSLRNAHSAPYTIWPTQYSAHRLKTIYLYKYMCHCLDCSFRLIALPTSLQLCGKEARRGGWFALVGQLSGRIVGVRTGDDGGNVDTDDCWRRDRHLGRLQVQGDSDRWKTVGFSTAGRLWVRSTHSHRQGKHVKFANHISCEFVF